LDGRDGDVPEDAAAKARVLVVGEQATGDAELGRAFRDPKSFRAWADTSPIAEQVDGVFKTLEEQVLPQRGNEDWVGKVQGLALERKQADMAALAELAGVDIRDEELVKLAMLDRTPLTPQTFDPVFLWDRRIEVEPPQGGPQDSRTSLMFIPPGWWPFLGWVGWDNRARSVRVFGLNILCDGAWFGGRWLWLIGFNMLLNLDRVFFDRMATSVISF
jgi:hypothetical protein